MRIGAARALQKLHSPRAEDAIRGAREEEVLDMARSEFEAILDELRAAR